MEIVKWASIFVKKKIVIRYIFHYKTSSKAIWFKILLIFEEESPPNQSHCD